MNSLITELFPVAFYSWLLCVLWAEIAPFGSRQWNRGVNAIPGKQVLIQLDLQSPLLLMLSHGDCCFLQPCQSCVQSWDWVRGLRGFGVTVWFLLCACRVLESLLVSLTTTVVVFLASMVLGECRQLSSTSQSGNDTLGLQVRPYVEIIRPHCIVEAQTHNELLTAFCST